MSAVWPSGAAAHIRSASVALASSVLRVPVSPAAAALNSAAPTPVPASPMSPAAAAAAVAALTGLALTLASAPGASADIDDGGRFAPAAAATLTARREGAQTRLWCDCASRRMYIVLQWVVPAEKMPACCNFVTLLLQSQTLLPAATALRQQGPLQHQQPAAPHRPSPAATPPAAAAARACRPRVRASRR